MVADVLTQDILDVCTHTAQFTTGGKEEVRGSYNTSTDDAAFLKVTRAIGTKLPTNNGVKDMSELNAGFDGDVSLNHFDFQRGGLTGSLSPFYQVSPLTSGSNSGNREERSKGTSGKYGKTIDKAILQMCLSGYGSRGWDGRDCVGIFCHGADLINVLIIHQVW